MANGDEASQRERTPRPKQILRIESMGPTLMRGKVFLNGMKIHLVRQIALTMSHEDITMATISFGVEEVDVDVDTMVKLMAEAREDDEKWQQLISVLANEVKDEIASAAYFLAGNSGVDADVDAEQSAPAQQGSDEDILEGETVKEGGPDEDEDPKIRRRLGKRKRLPESEGEPPEGSMD